MKTSLALTRALPLLAGAALLFTVPGLRAADKKADHEHGAEMAKPATAAAALEQAGHLHMALNEQVKAKKLKDVHDTAEKLTGVVNALPAFSKDLPTDKKTRVEGAVKNLAKALDALHDAADEGNQAGSEKQLAAVNALMKLLTAQYPAAHAH
jgi:hypothetical protein